MRKLLPVLSLILVLILLTGCGAGATESGVTAETQRPPLVYNPEVSKNDDKAETLSGSITINKVVPENNAYFEDTQLYNAAQVFMNEHPDVTISFNLIKPETRLDHFLTDAEAYRLSGEMARDTAFGAISGIIDFNVLNAPGYTNFESGVLSYRRMADYLVNLDNYMEKDADFRPDDYFMNIINAYKYDDGVKALCTNFMFDNVFSVRKDFGEYTERFNELVNPKYSDMMDIYFDYLRTSTEKKKSSFTAYFTPLDTFVYKDSAIDLMTKTVAIDTHEFITELNKALTIELSDKTSAYDTDVSWYKYGVDRTKVPYMFDGIFNLGLDELFMNVSKNGQGSELLYFPYKLSLFDMPKAVSTEEGNYLFEPVGLYGITESCPDKELAWAFLKFLISDFELDGSKYQKAAYEQLAGINSVNINNFTKYNEANFSFAYDTCYERDRRKPLVGKEETIDNAMKQVLDIAYKMNQTNEKDIYFRDAIYPTLYLLMSGQITAEAAAMNIQASVMERMVELH